jgi:hypothetical protein
VLPNGKPRQARFTNDQAGIRDGIYRGKLTKFRARLHDAARVSLGKRNDHRVIGCAYREEVVARPEELALQSIDLDF